MPRRLLRRLGRSIKKTAKSAYRNVVKPAMAVARPIAMAKLQKFAAPVRMVANQKIDSGLKRLSDMAISKISGMGDYQHSINSIKHNTIIRPTIDDNIPQFGNISGGVRVRHREYLGDLFSSGTFKNNVYRINPALKETFPWLSGLAVNFERYRFLGLCFEYKSGSSDALNSTNTALGYVVMASQYNSLATPFTNKQQMENTQFCVSTKPSMSVIHPIECDPSVTPNQPLYTRLSNVGPISAGDLRLYDHAQEEVAVVGMQQDDVNLGELWISYDVILYLPVLASGLALDAQTAHFGLNKMIGTTVIGATPYALGSDPQTVKFDNINGLLNTDFTSGNSTYAFPLGTNGKYLISWSFGGINNVDVFPNDTIEYLTLGLVNNAELLTVWSNGLAPQNANRIRGYRADPSSKEMFFISYSAIVNIPSPNLQCVLGFSLATTAANVFQNPSYGDLVITQINGNYE